METGNGGEWYGSAQNGGTEVQSFRMTGGREAGGCWNRPILLLVIRRGVDDDVHQAGWNMRVRNLQRKNLQLGRS